MAEEVVGLLFLGDDAKLDGLEYTVIQFLYDAVSHGNAFVPANKWVTLGKLACIINESRHFNISPCTGSMSAAQNKATENSRKRKRQSSASGRVQQLNGNRMFTMSEIIGVLMKVFTEHAVFFNQPPESVSRSLPTLAVMKVPLKIMCRAPAVYSNESDYELDSEVVTASLLLAGEASSAVPDDDDRMVMFFRFNYYSAPVHENCVLPCITNGLTPSLNSNSSSFSSGTDKFLGNLNKRACILGEHTIYVVDQAALETLYGPGAFTQFLTMFRLIVMLCHLYSGRFYDTNLLLDRLAALTKADEYRAAMIIIARGIIALVFAKCTRRINVVVCDTCSLKLPDGIYFTENAAALMIRQNVLFGNFPELRFLAAVPSHCDALKKCNPLSSHERQFSLSKLPFMPSVIYPMIPGDLREYLAVMHDTYGHQQASMLMYAAARREAIESSSNSIEFSYSNLVTTLSTVQQSSTKISIKNNGK